jgi:cytidine deaminase
VETSEIIAHAKTLAWPRELDDGASAGGVSAVIVSTQGNIYEGICIDVRSSMGFCAEHSAVAAMLLAGESEVAQVVAVHADASDAFHVLAPCGRCRELLYRINSSNLDSDVVLGPDVVVKLGDLLPHHDEYTPA